MSELVAPAEIAALAHITEKHVRRVIHQFSRPRMHGGRSAWRGAVLDIHPGNLVAFSSLPVELRDAALVARDQLSLPLPPRTAIIWNNEAIMSRL
ncbi:MAG: hypothetical protein ACK5LJ_08775 [Paracoccus sp. (in: a-proteobacteria)]